MTDIKWAYRRTDKKRVVVVGAGVAGMTAAHELVERGYEVEIVEMASEPFSAARPRIGGMARTSWARVPVPPDQPRWTALAAPARARWSGLAVDEAPPPIDVPLEDLLGRRDRAAEFLDALVALRSTQRARAKRDSLSVITSRELDDKELDRLATSLKALRGDWQLTMLRAPEDAAPADGRAQLCVQGSRIAGEHGFRFFPSFYRHMFDTMKRIPIQEAAIGAIASDGTVLSTDSARTAFDALQSAEVIQLGLAPRGKRDRTFEIARRPMRSPYDIRAFFANVLERGGYRGRDLFRLATRYAEYLTSAARRRTREYEAMSWERFLGLKDGAFSKYFAGHVNSGAQALVAMSSHHNDARTIGSIAMQLTLDQMRANPSGYTDATLRGPTTSELFEPWRDYLESQDVRFTCAQLVGFYGHGMAVRPAFGRAPRAVTGKPTTDPDRFEFVDVAPADYYVLTVPVDRFQALFDRAGEPTAKWKAGATGPRLLPRKDVQSANQRCLELDRLTRPYPGKVRRQERERDDDVAKFLEFPVGDFANTPDAGPMRYMCGIQFYFTADVRVILGHTVCLDSPWGVSFISQVQYWQDHIRSHSRVRGIISAIFTLFQEKAPDMKGQNPKTALECSPSEIAERVWRQILDSWDESRFDKLPYPEYYYLDESLNYDQDTGAWTNSTPYLVNGVGDWARRGGVRLMNCDYVYRMQFGHTVFAGAFMRTETRLNTMEAANESGRRAANAILSYDHAPHQLARVWNIEDHEIPDAIPLRKLDESIFRRGGRHILRHPVVDAALRVVPWDLIRIGLPPRGERR